MKLIRQDTSFTVTDFKWENKYSYKKYSRDDDHGPRTYQVNEKNLFTGDILSLHDGKLGQSVKFFDLDHDMTTKSISKITNIPNVEVILTSHWGISKDYKNAVKDWKE